MLDTNYFFIFSFLIFSLLVFLLIFSDDFISFLMYLEVCYLVISFFFLFFSALFGIPFGKFIVFCLITVAAAEAALGFTLLVICLAQKNSTVFKNFSDFY